MWIGPLPVEARLLDFVLLKLFIYGLPGATVEWITDDFLSAVSSHVPVAMGAAPDPHGVTQTSGQECCRSGDWGTSAGSMSESS